MDARGAPLQYGHNARGAPEAGWIPETWGEYRRYGMIAATHATVFT
jgi:hypothetical protein